jgi:hypothetical protein
MRLNVFLNTDVTNNMYRFYISLKNGQKCGKIMLITAGFVEKNRTLNN